MNQLFSQEITKYRQYLAEEYRPSTIEKYSKHLLRYLEWMQTDRDHQSKSIESSVLAYIHPNNDITSRSKDLKSVRAAIHLYYHLLGFPLHSAQNQVHNPYVEAELDAYVAYLKEISGLAETTLFSHRGYLKRLIYSLFPS